ncbi:MAG: DUF1566 domain-containing protein [Legionella sp.]|nr:DUF1566 domain-containing protein [Legionella sp.]
MAGPQGPRGESALAVNYKAGPGIVIENDTIRSAASHRIGEQYQGGVVFWVDGSGQHGLVVSKHDLNEGQGIQWRNGDSGNKITNARSDGIHAGDVNTRLIVASQTIDNQSGNFAALVASTFAVQADGETPCDSESTSTCYGGWYLPSRYELSLLANNTQHNAITSFAPDYYWSSTEASVSEAWLQAMPTGEQMASEKASTLGRVRAVHAF